MPVHRLFRSAVATMALCAVLGYLLVTSVLAAPSGAGALVQDSEEVAPANPVVGTEIPGDPDVDRTDYALLAVLASCLIGAGILLVWVERWERRRSKTAFADSRE